MKRVVQAAPVRLRQGYGGQPFAKATVFFRHASSGWLASRSFSEGWWARLDSNQGQRRYERRVLTAELQAQSRKSELRPPRGERHKRFAPHFKPQFFTVFLIGPPLFLWQPNFVAFRQHCPKMSQNHHPFRHKIVTEPWYRMGHGVQGIQHGPTSGVRNFGAQEKRRSKRRSRISPRAFCHIGDDLRRSL